MHRFWEKIASNKKIIVSVIAVPLVIVVTISGWLHFYDFQYWQYFKKGAFENLKPVKGDETKLAVIPNFFRQESQRMVCLARYMQQFDSSRIGWISDIHADRFKRRTIDSGTIFPKKYKEYLPKVFDALSRDGIYTVITTGDNTNTSGLDYARDIEMIAQEKCMNVIWVKGNHDNFEVMNELGISGNLQYYFTDYGSTRIIVLNNIEMYKDAGDYSGGIDDAQLEWVNDALKTDRQVIVAMHIPIFPLDLDSVVLDRYAKLENMLHENQNVKIVLSGHFHIPWQKVYNGINYYGEGALTYEGAEGAYAIIDLTEKNVKYEFAK